MEKALQPRQLAAIELLGRGMSQANVATEVGVSQSTIKLWLTKPEFATQAEIAKENFFAAKAANIDEKMNSLESKAMDTLRDMLSEDKPDSIRLKAVQLILNHQNSRKTDRDDGKVLVNFNLPEPGMPSEQLEEGDTSDAEH